MLLQFGRVAEYLSARVRRKTPLRLMLAYVRTCAVCAVVWLQWLTKAFRPPALSCNETEL